MCEQSEAKGFFLHKLFRGGDISFFYGEKFVNIDGRIFHFMNLCIGMLKLVLISPDSLFFFPFLCIVNLICLVAYYEIEVPKKPYGEMAKTTKFTRRKLEF